MKSREFSKVRGIGQVVVLVIMSLLAVSLPIVTRLAQQSQENRSKAAESDNGNPSYLVFRFVMDGIKPTYINEDESEYNCFENLGKLKVDFVNRTTGKTQTNLEIGYSPVEGEVNSNGDQIFETDEITLDNKFDSTDTNNFLKIRGSKALMRVVCHDGQTELPANDSSCDISVSEDSVIDVTEYPLVMGDVNSDGLVNSIDYGVLKKNFDADSRVTCGSDGDLNGDGVVNWVDGNLLKNNLSVSDDEVSLSVANSEEEASPTSTPTESQSSTLTPTPTSTSEAISPTVTSVLSVTPTTESVTPTVTVTVTPTSALTPTETGAVANVGTAYSSNSSSCRSKDGVCATYSKSLSTGSVCKVTGYSLEGKVKTGLCPGSTKVVCCVGIGTTISTSLTPTVTQTVTPTLTPTPTLTQSDVNVLDPIIPDLPTYSVVTDTLKFWIKRQSGYYITRIWAKEPYRQLKKYSAADYSKQYDQIDTLISKALTGGGIKTKAALATNNDISVKYEAYYSNSKYWDKYTSTGIIINNGVVYRNDFETPSRRMLAAGIDNSNNLKLFEETLDPTKANTADIIAARRSLYQSAIDSGVQNTITNFGYVIKDSEITQRVKDLTPESHERQILCQVNKNNFILVTTTSGFTVMKVATIAKDLGCTMGIEMDGGGSTALYYKQQSQTSWAGLDKTSRDKMWSILYWTEL